MKSHEDLHAKVQQKLLKPVLMKILNTRMSRTDNIMLVFNAWKLEFQYPITMMLAAGIFLRANSLLSTNGDKSPGTKMVFILQYGN
jgi:hypothetical protein